MDFDKGKSIITYLTKPIEAIPQMKKIPTAKVINFVRAYRTSRDAESGRRIFTRSTIFIICILFWYS